MCEYFKESLRHNISEGKNINTSVYISTREGHFKIWPHTITIFNSKITNNFLNIQVPVFHGHLKNVCLQLICSNQYPNKVQTLGWCDRSSGLLWDGLVPLFDQLTVHILDSLFKIISRSSHSWFGFSFGWSSWLSLCSLFVSYSGAHSQAYSWVRVLFQVWICLLATFTMNW